MGLQLADRAVRIRLVVGAWTNLYSQDGISDDIEQKLQCTDTVRAKVKVVPDHFTAHIRKLQSEMRALVARYCLRFGDGWVLPTGLFDTFMVAFDQLKDQMKQAQDELEAGYIDILDAIKQKQGTLQLTNYMPPDGRTFARGFWQRLTVEPIGDPSTWQSKMPAHVVSEIKQNFSNFISEASQEAVSDALSRMEGALAHLVNKLADPEAVFKEATVAKVRELIELLPHFNITDDPRVTQLHKQLTDTLLAVDAPTLRNDQGAREDAVNQAKQAIDVIQVIQDQIKVKP